jgi:hypothetical protein
MDAMSVNAATVRSVSRRRRRRERARVSWQGSGRPAIAAEAPETVVLMVSELVTDALCDAGVAG